MAPGCDAWLCSKHCKYNGSPNRFHLRGSGGFDREPLAILPHRLGGYRINFVARRGTWWHRPSKTPREMVPFFIFCILAERYWPFCSQDLLEAPGCPGSPWVPPGCLLGASWVPPGCLLGVSWVPPETHSRLQTPDSQQRKWSPKTVWVLALGSHYYIIILSYYYIIILLYHYIIIRLYYNIILLFCYINNN